MVAPASKQNATELQSIRELLRLLPGRSGFQPYSLVAFAYCGDERRECLRRSFRFEAGTCCTHLSIEASRRSRWRKALERKLLQAGYEPWFSSSDSAQLRRWLRTGDDRRRELGFLAELGLDGAVAPRFRRRVRGAPPPDYKWRAPRAEWLRVARQVCEADLRWDEVSLSFSRTAKRPAPTPSNSVWIVVSLLPIVRTTGRREYYVSADVSHPDSKRRLDTLPPNVAGVFRRFLRTQGLAPDGARSPKTGKVDRKRVGFRLVLKDARSATRRAQRVFAGLVSLRLQTKP